MESVRLASGVAVEDLGDEIVVLVEDRVVTLSSRHSDSLRLVLRREELSEASQRLVDDLIQMGICERTSAGLSRRGFVGAGAGIAGAVVGTIAMPSLAHASSLPDGPPVEGTYDWFGGNSVGFYLDLASFPVQETSGWTLSIDGRTIPMSYFDEDGPFIAFEIEDLAYWQGFDSDLESSAHSGTISGNGFSFTATFIYD